MTKLIHGPELNVWQNWNTATAALKWPERGGSTRWVYIGPNGRFFDLEGRNRGRQGARLQQQQPLGGATHLPFEQLFTESAYQVGATYERTNITKRLIDFGVILGGTGYTEHQYRMIENNWWDSWPYDTPGWLGCNTRFNGWRWAQVMLAKPVATALPKDPAAFGNNVAQWTMQIVAPKPWFAKRTLYTTWNAHPETVSANGFDQETIAIANRGQLPVWPMFLVKGPGRAWVQDGMTSRMVELPELQTSDGYVLVDTDPANRTLTSSTDPVDNIFYEILRQSRVLDFFLHDLDSLGLPVWQRAGGIRFLSQIPPRTVANITVKHDNPTGSITVLMPQRYVRSS